MAEYLLKCNPISVCRILVADLLNDLEIEFELDKSGELMLPDSLDPEVRRQVDLELSSYGITLQNKQEDSISDSIKRAIDELLVSPGIRTEKVSAYLTDKLGYSYPYLSSQFSEATLTSIENFLILRRIEKVKTLLIEKRENLTEIAQKLDYSSVAHLSRQFKKTTGLTPTAFVRIIEKRKSTKIE